MSKHELSVDGVAGDLAAVGSIQQLLRDAGVRAEYVTAASNAVLTQLERTTGANAQGTPGMLPGASIATGSSVAKVVGRGGDRHASMEDVSLVSTGDITRTHEAARSS